MNCKHTLLLAAAALTSAGFLASAGAPLDTRLSVVATIPDLADVAREIGGERVNVRSIARGRENVHAVQIRPSDLIATSRADVFLQVGLSLEHAWVPGLLQTARNRRIQPGAPGFMNVSEGWKAIQVPETLSRSEGVDIHPQGNPHINLSPRAGRHVGGRVLEVLARCDPEGREHYERRHRAYLERLDAAEKRWAKLARQLHGRKVVVYHQSHDYLLEACGIETRATIESKPGVPPTPAHLAQVIELMKREGIDVILTSAWSNDKSIANVARKAGARIVELPAMVGGAREGDTWIGMMDLLHQRLAEAFGVAADS